MRAAVFLDRDGVLTIPEFRDGRSFAPLGLEEFSIYPDAPAALQRLDDAGFVLIVATNQPDVGHGRIQPETLEEMNRILYSVFPLQSIEVCPHRQKDGCDCRKPSPGMLIRAAELFSIDLARSFMIGDRASDVEAGKAAGCSSVFVDRKYKFEPLPIGPDYICNNVSQAANWILSITRSAVVGN